MMQELYKGFVSNLTDGDPIVILIIVLVAVVINYKKIIEFFDSRKKVKILEFEEALKHANIKDMDRELLKNELTKEYFKNLLGIGVEKEFRHAIIEAHEKMKGELSFALFQRALPYMKYQNNTLEIKISKLDILGYYINIFLTIGFLFVGYVLLMYSIFNVSNEITIYVLGTGVFFIFIGFMLIYQLLYIISAQSISKKLKELDND